MDCNKEKRSYHFNVTEVVDGKIEDVMSFNFCCHHDLGALVAHAKKDHGVNEKHACELVLGMRLLHHVLKKYPEKAEFATFLQQLNNFKQGLKCENCGCDK